jgi:hypothetical protein
MVYKRNNKFTKSISSQWKVILYWLGIIRCSELEIYYFCWLSFVPGSVMWYLFLWGLYFDALCLLYILELLCVLEMFVHMVFGIVLIAVIALIFDLLINLWWEPFLLWLTLEFIAFPNFVLCLAYFLSYVFITLPLFLNIRHLPLRRNVPYYLTLTSCTSYQRSILICMNLRYSWFSKVVEYWSCDSVTFSWYNWRLSLSFIKIWIDSTLLLIFRLRYLILESLYFELSDHLLQNTYLLD